MTNRPPKSKVSNVSSILLSQQENDSVFGCLGRGCVALATGVVQLFLAEAPSRQKWTRKHCGVVCFTKDNPKRSYFIRVYDMKKKQLLWEQELYMQFTYKTPREYFHTFEADNCQAAINFASEDEALMFKKAVESKLFERQKKRHEKKQQRKQQSVGTTSPTPTKPTGPSPSVKVATGHPPASGNRPPPAAATLPASSKEKGNKKKKLTKEDISTPTDFRHISHVGWDPNTGLDMKKLDPQMKALFETIGIDDQSQVDEETIDFIYDFVDQHGGLEAVKKDLAKRVPPAPAPAIAQGRTPGFTPPPPPTRQTGGPPPPPPARTGLPAPPRPGRAGMALPPPPPPADRGPAPVRQPMAAPPPPPPSNRAAAPPPPPINTAPAAPPPPPPPAAPMPPPPPPAMGSGPPVGRGPPLPSVDPGRGALMDQIHKGTSLKTVERNSQGSGGDARGGLLDQIRTGTSLKPVDHTHDEAQAAQGSQGIVGALAQALAMRKNVIQGSDDDADSDDDIGDDDSDEWSD